MSDHMMSQRSLDARADRIDFRDMPYRPRLISLPPQFPPDFEVRTFLDLYLASGSIRNQGKEGACTGFGLAACIDYISWDRKIREERIQGQSTGISDLQTASNMKTEVAKEFDRVSPFMLYDIAKMYDEWEGEDYSGSSCRGALKGWHKHGVCADDFWRSPLEGRTKISDDWRENAAQRPLGAYYRVDSRSVSDLQAAIHEVRAVYCSSRVHGGWTSEDLKRGMPVKIGGLDVPKIKKSSPITGGHAFAMVGYTQDGFIIQNSWGREWGYNGFALLTYEDWIENGNDAWVAALGAPMTVSEGGGPRNRTSMPLALNAAMRATSPQSDKENAVGQSVLAPWTSDYAYDHSIVLGNEGMPLRRRIDMPSAAANLELVAKTKPLEFAKANGGIKIMLYAHGGLNSEKVAVERAMRMGPWMKANGIYPIFVVWRTSLLDTLANIKEDFIAQFIERREEMRSEGLGDVLDSAKAKLQSAFDKAFEVAAEGTLGKPVWSQMKQNAAAAANGNGGTHLLFKTLRELEQELAAVNLPMELHVVGHSAGAILLGHMLDDFDKKMTIKTGTLLAPACTMGFAMRYYALAFERKVLPKGGLHVHALSDANERDDMVGPYGKSLLYLVSRALETPRKQPLLGLAKCLEEGNSKLAEIEVATRSEAKRAELNSFKKVLSVDFSDLDVKSVRSWRDIARQYEVVTHIAKEREFIMKSQQFIDQAGDVQLELVKIPATHGAFDNSLTIMNETMARILGQEAPRFPIDDLSGF